MTNYSNLDDVPIQLLNDKEFILQFINENEHTNLVDNIYFYIGESLLNDKDIFLKISTISPGWYSKFPEEMKADKDIAYNAVGGYSNNFKNLPNHLKDDKDFIISIINYCPDHLMTLNTNLLNDIDILQLLRMHKNHFNSYGEIHKKWFIERMNVLDIYEYEESLKEIINPKVKNKNHKF